jgi:hypothetical protein
MPADSNIPVPDPISTSHPQTGLRFVKRVVDGRELRILQQLWGVVLYEAGKDGIPVPIWTATEWRDVPLIEEHGDAR